MAISKYANYYGQRIRGEKRTHPNKLMAGMFVDLYYRKPIEINGFIKFKKTRYLILVLHPNFHGYLHALKVTNIRPLFMRKWINHIGYQIYKGKKLLIFNFKYPKVNMNEKQTKQFYNKYIKKFIHSEFEDVYRTYLVKRIINVKIVNMDIEKI